MRKKNEIVNPYLFKLLKSLVAYKVKRDLSIKLTEGELKDLAASGNIDIKESYIVKVFRESYVSKCNFDVSTLDSLVYFLKDVLHYDSWYDFKDKEGLFDISIRSASIKKCFFHLNSDQKRDIIISVNRRVLELFNISSDLLPSTDIKWSTKIILGSSYHSYDGHIGLDYIPNGHPTTSFSGNSTIILGSADVSKKANYKETKVTWIFDIDINNVMNFKEGFLVFACKRYFGGLHAVQFDDYVRLNLNSRNIDGFNLRVKPENHSTYFHRVPSSKNFPIIKPICTCETVYTWRLFKDRLNVNGTQVLEVVIGPSVRWDIDYLGVVYSVFD